MSDRPIEGLMGTTLEKIRQMVDVNTVVGNPITAPNGTTVIPVSKVMYGFASGDLPGPLPDTSAITWDGLASRLISICS